MGQINLFILQNHIFRLFEFYTPHDNKKSRRNDVVHSAVFLKLQDINGNSPDNCLYRAMSGVLLDASVVKMSSSEWKAGWMFMVCYI